MIYTLSGRGPIGFDLTARRFFYTTIQGRYLLLDWIAKHTDHAGEVQLWLPPHEQPNTWFSDMAVKIEPAWLPGMGRVLNVAEIGGMQVGTGKFSAQISDPMCPWNEGVWAFEGKDGVLQVQQGGKADCHLNIQGLSSLVYGTNDPASYIYRGWGDPNPEIQMVMREMFSPMKPYLLEMF
jgi:predicted acetyltransferase